MKKQKMAIATFMAVPIIATVAVSPSTSLATDQNWISEESAVFQNPQYKGQPIEWSNRERARAVKNNNLIASNLSDLMAIVENEMGQFSNNVSIHYTGDTSNLMEEIDEVIRNSYQNNDYIHGTIANWEYGYSGYTNNVMITLQFNYHTTPAQEEFIASEVKRITKEIVKPEMSEVEKVKAINDYIVLNSTYSYDTSTTPHAVYAILNEGKGVCQAYALLAYRLLKEAGIEVRYVTGWANELHAWNMVRVDGQWYHLDTTWNDPLFQASAGDMSDYISYQYFLISDSEIAQDHIMDDFDYPNATSDRFVAMRGISSPIQNGTILYFPNRNDNIKLYKLDLSSSILQAEKVSDTRVQHLLYANNWLYYSNYSDSGFLYKMKLDGTSNTLLEKREVTKIKREGSDLVAYANNAEIYREAIQDNAAEETPNLEKINQLIDKANKIVFLSKHFKTQAEEVLSLYKKLTTKEQLLVTEETRSHLSIIQAQYEKMQTLTFQDTTAWASLKTITDAKKKWTVQLNQDILNSPENLELIQVVDMFGDWVEVSIQIDGKTITAIPMENYVEDVPYTLVINSNLKNTDGKVLGQGIHLQFKFQTK